MMPAKRTEAVGRWASRRRWQWRWPSGLLAVVIALGCLPGTTWAADEPDLKLEQVRLFANAAGQVNDKVVSFKVTNVGNRDASQGTGKIEFLSPAPAREEALTIPKLARNGGSFEGFAQLGAPCDGHMVRLAVSAPGETSFADNTVGPVKLCPDKPKPAPKPGGGISSVPVEIEPVPVSEALPDIRLPVEIEPDLVSEALPEHLRVGTHELEFEPSALRSLARWTHDDVHSGPHDDSRHPDSLRVGWSARSGLHDFVVQQTAVNFDLARLLEARNPFVAEAHLSFVEHEEQWTGAGGGRAEVPGCVAVLGQATNDWGLPPRSFVSPDFLFRNRYLTDVFLPWSPSHDPPDSGQHWRAFDATGHVRSQLSYRDDPELWFGYVLRGAVELDDGANTACTSRLSQIRLWVTYVVGSP